MTEPQQSERLADVRKLESTLTSSWDLSAEWTKTGVTLFLHLYESGVTSTCYWILFVEFVFIIRSMLGLHGHRMGHISTVCRDQ
jgi:hypothetical protein